MEFKLIAIIAFVLVFLYQSMVIFLRQRSEKNPIPKCVSDVYDNEAYEKWRAYHRENNAFDIKRNAVSFLVELLLLIFNVYAAFAKLFPNTVLAQTFAVVLLSTATSIVMLPFSWYEIMVIEQKYGFNKTTAKTFFGDQIKSFILSLMLLTGLSMILYVLHDTFGDWLILVFAVTVTILLLIITFLFPILSRVFNKFKPLEEGELRTKLEELLEKNGYRVRAINVMDASRRTTKSNAYFSGFGKMKTIVLFDNMVESFETDEIVAVFAHELGHGLHKDTLKNNVLSFLQMLIIGFFAWVTLRTGAIFEAFGFDRVNYGFAMILIMSVEFAFISPLSGLIRNYFSRKAEYGADRQAVKEGYGLQLIGALKKLARQNFSNLAPDPLVVKLEYSHPTLSERIEAVENLMK